MAKLPYILCFGPFELDGVELRRKGDHVGLSPQRVAILLHLLLHRDEVVSRSELTQVEAPSGRPSEGSIPVAIAGIREVLGDARHEPPWIKTYSGQGYRFTAQVIQVYPGQPAVLIQGQHNDPNDVDALDLADKIGRWRYLVCTTDPEFPRPTHRVRIDRVREAGAIRFRATLQSRSGVNPRRLGAESLGVLSSYLVAEIDRDARARACQELERDPCAWHYALAGVDHAHRYVPAENRRAHTLLEQAIQLDPNLGYALIHLAIASNFALGLGWGSSRSLLDLGQGRVAPSE